MHISNSVSSLSMSELEQIFTTRRMHWPSGRRIIPFNLPPRSLERAGFDRVALRMDPDEVARYWIDRRIRGGAPAPRQVPSPSLTVRVVVNVVESIAYAPARMVGPEVKVVARLRGGRVL